MKKLAIIAVAALALTGCGKTETNNEACKRITGESFVLPQPVSDTPGHEVTFCYARDGKTILAVITNTGDGWVEA